MTFHVGNLLSDARTLDVHGATVTYNPQRLTVADYERVESDEGWGGLSRSLASIVDSWDLADDAGPIPVTEDGVKRLPIRVMDMIMGAIMDDMRPSSAEGNASSGGSPMPELASTKPPETSLNGTDLFRQPGSTVALPGSSPDSLTVG